MSAISSAKNRVIVADDHKTTRDALTALLQRRGYSVTTAQTGTECLDLLYTLSSPAIALVDWMMPEMTGLDVCRAARSSPVGKFVYFIVLTARDSVDDLTTAFAAGADDFICKPCEPAELMARLHSGERMVELEHRLSARVSECEEALERVRMLKHLLPICMYCKKVRDDSDYWQEIETYIKHHTGTDFSHGICPHCMNELALGLQHNLKATRKIK